MTKTHPIFVTGCERSGTSMTAGILALCGAWGGLLTDSNKYNRKGTFENRQIRDKVIVSYLRSIGVDPLGQSPLPTEDELVSFPRMREVVLEILKEQGMPPDATWFFKSSRMCLFWQEWADAFPEAKWVIVRREDEAIIQSCMRTGYMQKIRGPANWQRWIDEHKRKFQQMEEANLELWEVWPTTFIDGDYSEIRETVKGLGLTWKEDQVQSFVNPALWGGK